MFMFSNRLDQSRSSIKLYSYNALVHRQDTKKSGISLRLQNIAGMKLKNKSKSIVLKVPHVTYYVRAPEF